MKGSNLVPSSTFERMEVSTNTIQEAQRPEDCAGAVLLWTHPEGLPQLSEERNCEFETSSVLRLRRTTQGSVQLPIILLPELTWTSIMFVI